MYTAHTFVSRSRRLAQGLLYARRACGSHGNIHNSCCSSGYSTTGNVSSEGSNQDDSLPGRTLFISGIDEGDELQRHLRTFASSFMIRELPNPSTRAQVSAAVAIRKPDRTLDRGHTVAAIFKAVGPLPDPSADDDADSSPWPKPSTRLEHVLELVRTARVASPHAFIILCHADAVEEPELRVAAFTAGANMVTCYPEHVMEALTKLVEIGDACTPSSTPDSSTAATDPSTSAPSSPLPERTCTCPWCGQTGLTPLGLWLHQPLYHVYEENRGGFCGVCGLEVDNLARHIHGEHRPTGPHFEVRRGLGSAVVIHRRRDNKFLMVQEFAGQGFWVPGGGTDQGESLQDSAVRECMEEAGVEVDLRGLVEVVYTLSPTTRKPTWRLAIFYATLRDEDAPLKTVPCFESAGSCWVSLEQLPKLPLRSGRIPITWFPRFAAGIQPKPLALPEGLRELFADVKF